MAQILDELCIKILMATSRFIEKPKNHLLGRFGQRISIQEEKTQHEVHATMYSIHQYPPRSSETRCDAICRLCVSSSLGQFEIP